MALSGVPRRIIHSLEDATANWEWLRNLKVTNSDLDLTGVSGDVTFSSTGVSAIGSGKVTNADVNSTAGLTLGQINYPYLCYQDQKAVNTAGGTFTTGSYQTRNLNTEVADTGNFGSVASNQITLAAGTYRVRGSAPAYAAGQHKIRLRNVTDSTTLLVGTSERAVVIASADAPQTRSMISGRFTIAAQKTLEIQHACTVTRVTDGFGTASNLTEVEVYAEVEFWKEA